MCERSIGCTPLINRVRRHLASQCFEIDNLAAIPCLSKCQKNVENGDDVLDFLCKMCSVVSFLNILAQKEQYFLMWNLRLVLFSNFTGSNHRLLQRACISRNWAYTSSHASGNRAALPTKNTACWMETVLIFQEMLDFSTPGSFKLVKWMFLYMLFNTIQYMRLN